MATKKFPLVLHITVEGEGDEQYYNVQEDGVFGVDEDGKPIAVYQRVEVGKVAIGKKFVAGSAKKRKR